MSRLAEIQQQFMHYLLAADNDKSDSEELTHQISQQQGLSAKHRLQIYANAYRIRLTETMETDHQILGLYLGDDLFDKMAKEYTQAFPSKAKSLRQFCDNLPSFLASDSFFSAHPILADLARFERRLLNAFDAAEAPRADYSELQNIPPQQWPDICLRFHPSVQLFKCKSNAVESWQALKGDEQPKAPDYQIERYWLLWRNQQRLTQFESLHQSQFALINGFIEGHNFAQQCELMLNWYEADLAPMKVLQTLQDWFAKGIIRSVIV
ncbi:HvfC/BufC N-terminal domain-containing protein [Shewanella donghaensis]|uniref:HvfC/BufC N-terminal domain-containing protein n=1 Tax=Shewanella donghaensis TaxID=238836 RepID=UPI0011843986|nr:DNA-binding domain-containing protein [Shewanella donghaensis]